MKKYLPQTKKNPQGFTLIELLVVIAIIAILAIVGIALFSGVQSKARDTKRIQDVTAMSKSMEVQYVAGSGYVTTLADSWFADGKIPTNPGPNGASYSTGTPTTSNYTFCALLENSTGNATNNAGQSLGQTTSGNWFCKKNNQ